jgi:hypothetical protein
MEDRRMHSKSRAEPFLIFAFAIIALVALVWSVFSAPIPKAKAPVKPLTPSVVGSWNMSWQNISGFANFLPDGKYNALWRGDGWTGTWKVKDDRLTVEEETPSTQGGNNKVFLVWSVKLDKTGLAGEIDLGGKFALTAITKKSGF